MLPPLLFAGFPGGLELVMVFLVLFLLFGVPATLLILLGYDHVTSSADAVDEGRLAELESEVEALRDRLESEDRRGPVEGKEP